MEFCDICSISGTTSISTTAKKTKKKCAFENCNISPCFNFPDKNGAIYCKTHKLEGMIDTIHPKCEFEN
jgi:hypothetical protein